MKLADRRAHVLVEREDQCPVPQVVPVETAAPAPEDLAWD
jgi:hypothetical protein